MATNRRMRLPIALRIRFQVACKSEVENDSFMKPREVVGRALKIRFELHIPWAAGFLSPDIS